MEVDYSFSLIYASTAIAAGMIISATILAAGMETFARAVRYKMWLDKQPPETRHDSPN
jgi:hypothetical protein